MIPTGNCSILGTTQPFPGGPPTHFVTRHVGDSFVTWLTLPHHPSVHAQRASHSDRDIVYITVNYGMSQWHCHYHSDWKLVQCGCAMGRRVRWGIVLSHMLNFYLLTSNHHIIHGLLFSSAVISLIEIVLHPVPSPALSNILISCLAFVVYWSILLPVYQQSSQRPPS